MSEGTGSAGQSRAGKANAWDGWEGREVTSHQGARQGSIQGSLALG